MTEPSGGGTATKRLLAQSCEWSFLKLWSYPNPHKDDGHERCDLLAVFGDTLFIFFDRENELPEIPERDLSHKKARRQIALDDCWYRPSHDPSMPAERPLRLRRSVHDGRALPASNAHVM